MTRKIFLLTLCLVFTSEAFASYGTIVGTIKKVHAGNDNWFGIRFYLNETSNTADGICNSAFVYMEPKEGTGYEGKVSVFLAAYMAEKNVSFTVREGRNGYCELVEGQME